MDMDEGRRNTKHGTAHKEDNQGGVNNNNTAVIERAAATREDDCVRCCAARGRTAASGLPRPSASSYTCIARQGGRERGAGA